MTKINLAPPPGFEPRISESKSDVMPFHHSGILVVGFEPTTLRLTAECSAVELLQNKIRDPEIDSNYRKDRKKYLVIHGF